MPVDSKKALFILNPAAGVRKARDLESQIRSGLDLSRFTYEIKVTSKQGDALQMTREAVAGGFHLVVAVGGDGTINEVAQGIEGSNSVLGIIPNGSGNGLARHLEIPLNIADALEVINNNHVITIDTASLNNYNFVSIAGVGFDARIANQYRKIKRRGFYGYLSTVLQQFFRYKERSFILDIDGKTMEKKAILISVANSNQFGYGTVIAPDARPDDGLLDVVVVKKFPLTELPHVLQLLFAHRIDKSQYVESYTGRDIRIVRDKGKWVNLDGEAVRTDALVHIQVKPASLKVLVPEDDQGKRSSGN